MASVPDTNLTLDQFYSLAAGHLPAKDLPLVEKTCTRALYMVDMDREAEVFFAAYEKADGTRLSEETVR